MAKFKEQQLARNMREDGLSLKEIASQLHVSKSSASLWCHDIVLTSKQIEKLHTKMVRGSYIGRMKGVAVQKKRKADAIEKYILQARKNIPTLNDRELFMIGLGLYWGEGSKIGSVRFYNQNDACVLFIMRWFRESLHIENPQFLMYVNINCVHKHRLDEVIQHWSSITGISVNQFRKPTLLKAKSKKVYENFSEHHGTLCIRVAKSTNLLYQILGWIKASHMAG